MKFMICVMSSMLKHDIMTDMSLTNNNQVNQHWRCTKTDIILVNHTVKFLEILLRFYHFSIALCKT